MLFFTRFAQAYACHGAFRRPFPSNKGSEGGDGDNDVAGGGRACQPPSVPSFPVDMALPFLDSNGRHANGRAGFP